MAWKAPTNTKYKKNLLSAERFYQLLAEQNNYMDRDTAFIFYMGLIALIGEELRSNKIVRLPHLGDLALVTQKSRVAWVGKVQAVIGPREILRFYPKEHLKRYFAKRQGPPTYLEILPPKFLK